VSRVCQDPIDAQLALNSVFELSAVSPLPSPAFAANLLTGTFQLNGALGEESRLIEALNSEQPPQPGIDTHTRPFIVDVKLIKASASSKPSKAGFGITRGGELIVRSVGALGGAAARDVATLRCNGPTSLGVSIAVQSLSLSEDVRDKGNAPRTSAPDDEKWEVMYLDQDLLICETTKATTAEQVAGDSGLLFWTRATQEHSSK